jgi:thiamine biosynthesis lipoprotein
MKSWVRVFFILLIFSATVYFLINWPRYRLFEAEFYGTFDTVVVVRGYAKNESVFNRGFDALKERMETLHRLYDIYHGYEGLDNLHTVNLQAGVAPVAVEPEIIDMLLLAKEGYNLTNAAVNIALGPVLALWREYRENGITHPSEAKLPPMDLLEEAFLLADMNDLIIDEENKTVFLRKAGMSLDVGSVAKAYAAGLALDAAKEAGLTSVIINAGGNIIVGGPPLDGRSHWNIGIQNPGSPAEIIETVYMNDTTLSCSGGYERFYSVDGTVYHHIIDPATLMPANRYKQVAVLHENAGLADILSTALFIMPYEEGRALAEVYGAEVFYASLGP